MAKHSFDKLFEENKISNVDKMLVERAVAILEMLWIRTKGGKHKKQMDAFIYSVFAVLFDFKEDK